MEPERPTVLIVEDHTATRRFLADNLAADGFEPIEAGTAAEGLRVIATGSPELAVIDLSLPDRDGLELLTEVRSSARRGGGLDSQLPVLILSGRGSELDRIRGFERGTDDYVVKPFSYSELRGRLDALLRRARARPRLGRLRVGALELDPMSRETWVDGAAVHLTNKEFALALRLATEPTRVFTRAELLSEVWGFQSVGATRTLDSHASRLRRKLSLGKPAVRRQRVGDRLPPARRGHDVVSTALSLTGWVAAGLVGALALSIVRAYGDRMEAVARACHELRGPLTAARLGLAGPVGQEPPSPGRLRAIDTELGRAALALDDLSGAGGSGRRLWRLDRVDLRELVADCAEAWEASASAAGSALRVGGSGAEAAVWGDRLRLAQAIGNLIANAIEHGRAPVEVHVAVRHAIVRVAVSDHGPGLRAPVAELRERPRRGRGVRGRGLAIAADVAEAHGGALVSAPSRTGATLVLELPVAVSGPDPAG